MSVSNPKAHPPTSCSKFVHDSSVDDNNVSSDEAEHRPVKRFCSEPTATVTSERDVAMSVPAERNKFLASAANKAAKLMETVSVNDKKGSPMMKMTAVASENSQPKPLAGKNYISNDDNSNSVFQRDDNAGGGIWGNMAVGGCKSSSTSAGGVGILSVEAPSAGSSDDWEVVECPACSSWVPAHTINEHLDFCLA
jgi:hypothetical protein